jgi:molybdenum cofactor sulfurtransferase
MGGMQAIQEHCYRLAAEFAMRLKQLRHEATNQAFAEVYGDFGTAGCDSSIHGSIVSFNLRWSDGSPIGFSEVAQYAEAKHIVLRTGCFCNTGGCQEALSLSAEDIEYNHRSGRVCGEDAADIVNGRPTGSIRVSFGFSGIQRDVDMLLELLCQQYLHKANPLSSLSLTSLTSPAVDHATLSSSSSSSVASTIILKKIYIYPIKSCGGYLVPADRAWKVSSAGLYLDRRYAVTDRQTNRVLTQKSYPSLAQVTVDVDMDTRRIHLSHPDMIESVSFAIDDNDEKHDGTRSIHTEADRVTVRLCGRQQAAVQREGFHAVDAWFSRLLYPESSSSASSCHLVIVDEDQQLADPSYSNASFVNEAQLLLISEESILALRDILLQSSMTSQTASGSISEANFRPNLVTCSGGSQPAHHEDLWTELQIEASASMGEQEDESSRRTISWKVVGPCSRCSAININATGAIDGRVFQTIGKYRKQGNRINFGQFLAWNNTATATVTTGDDTTTGSEEALVSQGYIRSNSILTITSASANNQLVSSS